MLYNASYIDNVMLVLLTCLYLLARYTSSEYVNKVPLGFLHLVVQLTPMEFSHFCD